jgi:hypothetical protein
VSIRKARKAKLIVATCFIAFFVVFENILLYANSGCFWIILEHLHTFVEGASIASFFCELLNSKVVFRFVLEKNVRRFLCASN